MAFNLLDTVKGLLGNEFAGKAASLLGENESNVKNAISGIVPSVLTGLLNKAGSGDPQTVLNLAKDASRSGIMSNLSGALDNSNFLSKGLDDLKSLLGDKVGNITSMISNFAGIKESSASSLLSMAAPAALGALGKHATETQMSAGGMLSFLSSQKDNILGALPGGLNLAGALGLGSLASVGGKLSGAVSNFGTSIGSSATKLTSRAEQKVGGNRWIAPLLIGIIALGILVFSVRGCDSGKKETVAATDTVARMTDQPTANATAPIRESMKVKLPDGTELDAYKGGIEDQLLAFLGDPKSVAGRDVWFDFDNLNFKTGSADLTEESMKQVQNIAAILKAYPKVKIKIGGYTDKTGDNQANIKLSKDRADAVAAALKSSGSDMSQIVGAEGYGSEFAKVSTDAPDEERKKDRRIAVSVRAM